MQSNDLTKLQPGSMICFHLMYMFIIIYIAYFLEKILCYKIILYTFCGRFCCCCCC